jgi:hypothetical protein
VNVGTALELLSVGTAVGVFPPTKIASEVVNDADVTDNMEPGTDEACTEPPMEVKVEGDLAVDANWRLDCPVNAGGKSLGT